MNQSEIRVFIPFRAEKTLSLRSSLLKDEAWNHEEKLDASFYLRYIDKIFDKSGILSDCFIASNTTLSFDFELEKERKITLNYLRIFSFDTDVGFLELRLRYDFEALDEVADICAKLRLCNDPVYANEKETTLNEIARGLLLPFGKVRIFDHISDDGLTRGELFVSLILDGEIQNLDNSIYKIASGLSSGYFGDTQDAEFYSNFSHIRWAITDRGVCNTATLSGNEKNDEFITSGWFSNTNQRYIVWYILVLHQKYFLYQCMNDIAEKSSSGTLKKFQKDIMNFNTKYRFGKISEESSHQTLYETMCRVKELDDSFKDIDEKVNRIEQHRELTSDKNTSKAMTIISILCVLSAFKDLFELISQNHTEYNFAAFLTELSLNEAILCVVFVVASLIALFIMLPKASLANKFKRLSQKITEKRFTKNK